MIEKLSIDDNFFPSDYDEAERLFQSTINGLKGWAPIGALWEGMMDHVLTLGVWWGLLFSLAGLLALFRQPVRWRWLILAAIVNAIYVASIFELGSFLPLDDVFPGLSWNWAGKIVAIATTLAGLIILRVATRAFTFREAGFTLRQHQGAVMPSLIVIALMVGLVMGLSMLAGETFSIPDRERLAYQATMPGLDEEPFYRGYLLAILMVALPSKGFDLGGANIGWAGIFVTLLFGMGHGLMVIDGTLSLQVINIILTAILGFGLYWVRMRTGSLVLPILGHNIINASGAFF